MIAATINAPTTTGRWVTDAEFSAHTSISRQTLANWRHVDSKAGRDAAAPGYPKYKRFGRCIRYWIEG